MKVVKHSVLCLALMGLMALPGYAQTGLQSGSTRPSGMSGQAGMSSQSQPGMNDQSGMNGEASGGAKANAESSAMNPQEFIKNAAQDDLSEVQIAQLAQQKSNNDQVKQLAQKLMSDHEQNESQIKQVAQKLNVQLPDKPDSKHQAMIDRLQKLNGTQFDRAFLHMQVKDHEKDVREFKQEASKAKDPNVKQYASQTLPVLESHLQMAKSTMQSEKASSKNQKNTETTASSQSPKR